MAALTPKQIETLRELVEAGVFETIIGRVEDSITNEWRAAGDLDAREHAHAKLMALRDVKRQIRKEVAGANDGGT